MKKIWKTIKKKKSLRKLDFRSRDQLCVGKVLTPYSPCHKVIPLIKFVKIYVVFKIFNFSHKNNKTLFKKKQFFVGSERMYLAHTCLYSDWRNGYVVLCERFV